MKIISIEDYPHALLLQYYIAGQQRRDIILFKKEKRTDAKIKWFLKIVYEFRESNTKNYQ